VLTFGLNCVLFARDWWESSGAAWKKNLVALSSTVDALRGDSKESPGTICMFDVCVVWALAWPAASIVLDTLFCCVYGWPLHFGASSDMIHITLGHSTETEACWSLSERETRAHVW